MPSANDVHPSDAMMFLFSRGKQKMMLCLSAQTMLCLWHKLKEVFAAQKHFDKINFCKAKIGTVEKVLKISSQIKSVRRKLNFDLQRRVTSKGSYCFDKVNSADRARNKRQNL